MKIVLFDMETDGHHLQHVNYLSHYLTEKGDEVCFFTTHDNNHIKRLTCRSSRFQVAYAFDSEPSTAWDNQLVKSVEQLVAIRRCFRFAQQWEADVIQFMSIGRAEIPLLFNVLTSRRSRLPSIYATLVVAYFLKGNRGTNSTLVSWYHAVNSSLIKLMIGSGLIKSLFVFSEDTKRELIELWNSASPSCIIAVPDPIEPFPNLRPQREARRRLGLPEQGSIFLFFGRTRWNKGPDILLEAARLVDMEFSVVIAGKADPSERASIEELADQIDTPAQVIARLDFIPDSDVKDYFLSADAVVLPYRRSYKGTSGILQHAAAAAKPVIATNVNQVGSIVSQWGLGVTVPPEAPRELARALRGFLTEAQDDDQTVRNAREYADQHHWRKTAQAIRNTYADHY